MNRFASLLALVLVLAACESTTEPNAAVGAYTLASVSSVGPVQVTPTNGTLSVDGGRFTMAYTLRSNVDPTPVSFQHSGRVTGYTGGTVNLLADDGTAFRGSNADGRLTLESAGRTFVWSRQ